MQNVLVQDVLGAVQRPGGADEGALDDLRSALRSGGAAGPAYFDGPGWLPAFAKLIEDLHKLQSGHAERRAVRARTKVIRR